MERGLGGRLDSVLAQCMYFGLSFGRVGADFRCLVCPIFERAAIHELERTIATGTARSIHIYIFEALLLKHHLHGFTRYRLLQELSSESCLETGIHAGSHSAAASSLALGGGADASSAPPTALCDWTGLALYCNALLTAFNSARLCLPATLCPRIVAVVQQSLADISEAIGALGDPNWKKSWPVAKQNKFKAACRLFAEELLPFVNRCLDTLFPFKAIATTAGLAITEQTLMVNTVTVYSILILTLWNISDNILSSGHTVPKGTVDAISAPTKSPRYFGHNPPIRTTVGNDPPIRRTHRNTPPIRRADGNDPPIRNGRPKRRSARRTIAVIY